MATQNFYQHLGAIQRQHVAAADYEKTLALLRALKDGTVTLDEVVLTADGWQILEVNVLPDQESPSEELERAQRAASAARSGDNAHHVAPNDETDPQGKEVMNGHSVRLHDGTAGAAPDPAGVLGQGQPGREHGGPERGPEEGPDPVP